LELEMIVNLFSKKSPGPILLLSFDRTIAYWHIEGPAQVILRKGAKRIKLPGVKRGKGKKGNGSIEVNSSLHLFPLSPFHPI
jgi:hypothetical protein